MMEENSNLSRHKLEMKSDIDNGPVVTEPSIKDKGQATSSR